ncbi:MAG TPA: hypothetical protein VHY83_03820 [Solirubrobacteraceae bacterium]|jgi:hypothetical protein|nr:hypothetical protein [Solirubrobacteraceae bacterium]
MRVGVAAVVAALAAAASAAAFQALPPGAQVNDDPVAGINKALDVSGEEPSNSDIVGGALTAGKPAVPWGVFRQRETNGAPPPHDQVFARSFAGGAWTTRGNGTVGGRSSASAPFSGSLNFDQGQDGEAPAIDFAGAGRTVPWATWYEETTGTGFANNNVFASRFDNTGDANQGKWIFGGQSRGTGGGGVAVPSLNIHTDQKAENPSVAGGSAVDSTKPGPWVAWQETTTLPTLGAKQIFVERPIGPGAENCDGVTPLGIADGTGHIPAIGGFCWQQTGFPRVGSGPDPSLNVDRSRDGVEPDIAFTGVNDSVPWVVWYEKERSDFFLRNNEMVFAAKGVKDAAADGGFHWTVVGSQLSGTLETKGNVCGESIANEEQCSLNKNPTSGAENVRVAGGTMNPANPTVPWVAWDEEVGGVKQIFVARLVGGSHFELANNGQPISTGAGDSTRPDITFSGNTPYVSWRGDSGGVVKGFNGHFVNPANPTFVLDGSDTPLTPTAQADVREPVSSSCIATPFNSDGATCQGGALGTPFFLFTNGTNPRSLFANAYQPGTPVTGLANGVTSSSATVNGTVNPEGASVKVSFQFGTTTAYGQSTAAQKTGADNVVDPFTAQLGGLPAGTTIHYRAVAITDFGTFVGADETLTTESQPPPPPSPPPAPGSGRTTVGRATLSGTTASVRISCTGSSGATCELPLRLTVTEKFKGRRLIALTARRHATTHRRVLAVGSTTVTLSAGQTQTVRVTLNSAGRKLLARRRHLNATLRVVQVLADRHVVAVSTQTLVFRASHHRRRH